MNNGSESDSVPFRQFGCLFIHMVTIVDRNRPSDHLGTHRKMWNRIRLVFIFVSIEHVGCILNSHIVVTTTPDSATQQTPGTNATETVPKMLIIGVLVDPWEQLYHMLRQYDVNNSTSFAEGLVSLQKLYCPYANMCGTSTEYRGKERYVLINY